MCLTPDLVFISGRLASPFLAVHGMMLTLMTSSGLNPVLAAQTSFVTAAIICCEGAGEELSHGAWAAACIQAASPTACMLGLFQVASRLCAMLAPLVT